MDLKYIENRVEGLTRHLLALADEAQHVIALADAQLGEPREEGAAAPAQAQAGQLAPDAAKGEPVLRRSSRERVWSRGAVCAAAARKAQEAEMARLPAASATLSTAAGGAPGSAPTPRVEAPCRTLSGMGTSSGVSAMRVGVGVSVGDGAGRGSDAEDAGASEITGASDLAIATPGATLTFTQATDSCGPQSEKGGASGSTGTSISRSDSADGIGTSHSAGADESTTGRSPAAGDGSAEHSASTDVSITEHSAAGDDSTTSHSAAADDSITSHSAATDASTTSHSAAPDASITSHSAATDASTARRSAAADSRSPGRSIGSNNMAASGSHAFHAPLAGTLPPGPGPASVPPQPSPQTFPLCLEPLRVRTEEALKFLYEDPKAVHRGITYLDYPGSDRAEKRMNFAMFRRGMHGFNRHCGDLEGRALKQRLLKLSEQNRENGKKHKGTKRRRD